VAAGGATELHLEWSSGIPAGARGDALLAAGERLTLALTLTLTLTLILTLTLSLTLTL